MGRRQRGEVPAELARAQDRFQSWRRARQPRARIPEPLWALAVKLVGAHGLHRTASTLKLDYYSLKRRVGAAAVPPETAAPAFIELDAAAAVARECVIEFEDGTGVSLRVQLKGYDASEVVAVGRSVRNAQ